MFGAGVLIGISTTGLRVSFSHHYNSAWGKAAPKRKEE